MADALFGFTSVPVPWPMFWFTGLAPGPYSAWYADPDHDDLFTPALGGGVSVGVLGDYNVMSVASALVVAENTVYIATGDPNPIPGGDGPTVIVDSLVAGWTVADPVSPYFTAAPVLSAEPGDGEVLAEWTAGVPNGGDSHADVVYMIDHSTSNPPPFVPLDVLPGLSYLDAGRVNGTTYYYRVNVDLQIHGTDPDGFLAVGRASNVAAATPVDAPDVIEASLDMASIRFRIS